MRFDSRFSILPLCLSAALVACAGESPALHQASNQPAFIIIPGGDECTSGAETTGILPPINADSSSSFQLGRTIPVKIRFTDCVSGEPVNTLMPVIELALVGDDVATEVAVESSSAADDGNTMRSAGSGQYIFNLSTKRSQFNNNLDLTPGMYELKIKGSEFAEVVVKFAIRP